MRAAFLTCDENTASRKTHVDVVRALCVTFDKGSPNFFNAVFCCCFSSLPSCA